MSNCTAWLQRVVAVTVAALGLTLAGCGTYVPDGATVVKVLDSKHEFERGELRPPENELRDMAIVKMKWYDTNTFITTASLSPGVYSFMARNYDGAAIQRDIAIAAEKDYYEISAGTKAVDTEVKAAPEIDGPEIKGRILSAQAARIANVAVLFIGNEVILKTANVGRDGSFSVKSPKPGHWKIEIHRLGNAPVSYVHPVTNVKGPMDLGAITLK